MTTSSLRLVLTVVVLTSQTECAKILGVFPLPGYSHYQLERTYMKALAEAGHNITIISMFGEENLPQHLSYRDIIIKDTFVDLSSKRKKSSFCERYDNNPYKDTLFLMDIIEVVTEATMTNQRVQDLMKSGEKFDVVVVEQFLNDAMKAFATHFNGHLILFNSLGANSIVNSLVCNPSTPSYIPEVLTKYGPDMTLLQRLNNVLYQTFFSTLMHFYWYPKQKQIVEKYFPNAPPFEEILYNASLVLINAHESVDNASPFVPMMKYIGGLHVSPAKKLPADLQEFLDNANDGVVYFSMGSILQSKDLLEGKQQAILEAFGKLKQKFLWKWESESLPQQPSNVHLTKWVPQSDVLVHRGVPILTIPIYGDQEVNGRRAEFAGYGLVLQFKELTEENLGNLLEELLTNSKYKDNAAMRSRIMKDRPIQPLENAVYWTEYVIRHNGAKHLRVAGLDLS